MDIGGQEWKEKMRRLGVEPFLTTGVDLESHLLDATHLNMVNDKGSESDFTDLIYNARVSTKEKSIAHYVNGRIAIRRSNGTHATIDHGKLAVEAANAVDDDLTGKAHGKTVLKQLRTAFRSRYSAELQIMDPSEHIAVSELRTIANKAFKKLEKLS